MAKNNDEEPLETQLWKAVDKPHHDTNLFGRAHEYSRHCYWR